MKSKISLLIIGVLFLSGCGFHLRGLDADITLYFQRVHIRSVSADAVASEIKRILIEDGLEVVQTAKEAQIVVYLRNEKVKRRILSISSDSGKLEEIELHYRIEMEVRKPDDTVILENQPISLVRDYRYNELAVLATGAEEEMLHLEMFRDIVAQIMHRMQVIRIDNE